MYIGETYYHYIYGEMKISQIQRVKKKDKTEDVYVTFKVLDVKSVYPLFKKQAVTFNEFEMKKFCFKNVNDVVIRNEEYQHPIFEERR